MRKFGWLLASISGAALLSAAAVQGVAVASTGHHQPASHQASTVLRFHTMAPVTGPYVGTANPVRGIPGGGLPWIIKSARGSLDSAGHLVVRVRGLVLAEQAPVPTALQGTNPLPDFQAVVSCQSIGSGNSATVVNVSTGNFAANTDGDSTISASVNLPSPCIAPVVFVTGGSGFWLAASGA